MVSEGVLSLLCSLHCTVGSGVCIYLVFVMGSACRDTEVSFIVQLGVIDRELALASYGCGDTCVCTQVHLADQKTVVRTTEIVRGVLSLMSDEGKEFKGEVDAIVWSMKGLDFILGLPDIVRDFITLFFMMLKDYRQEHFNGISERIEAENMKPSVVS